MALTATFTPFPPCLSFSKLNLHRSSLFPSPSTPLYPKLSLRRTPKPLIVLLSNDNNGGSGGGSGDSNGGGGGGGGGGGEGGDEEDASHKNKGEAILALAELGRSLDSIPSDLAAAIEAGRIPGSIVYRYFELEKSRVFRWLLQFGGFKERLLADDLFLTKVGIECGVGIFTKTAAELERRRENFTKELDFVFADVLLTPYLMKSRREPLDSALGNQDKTNVPSQGRIQGLTPRLLKIRYFMLVWLPAPTVSLRPPIAVSAGRIAKFFYGCPDNAFQVALSGTSYSFLQRIGAIVRNGSKLFAVGTGASLVGTGVTNALIAARKAIDKSFAGEAEDVPILSTSVGYGVYMAVSSNLRYQVLAGVIEQRILEPLLHQQKLILSAICFVVRTGNTFLGSLMWVDYARWTGIQKIRE